MMVNNFICASANIEKLDDAAAHIDIVQKCRGKVNIQRAMSNNFSFGGTNASVVFQRFDG
jgi:3-oxoacyl-[acyl-carrier-protein] synthase-1